MYLAWTTVTVPVPRWTLVGFNRLTVPLHHPQQQSFVITSKQMSVWLNDTVGFYIPQGDDTTTTTNNNNTNSNMSIIFMALYLFNGTVVLCVILAVISRHIM